MSAFSKIRIAVVRGGDNPDYAVSLSSGEHVLSVLRALEDSYEPVDIFISKNGEWHERGLVVDPHYALKHVDLAWNTSRGAEKIMEQLHLPFVGSSAVASTLAETPHVAKDIFARHNLRTPAYTHVDEAGAAQELMDIFRRFMHPVAVRSASARQPIVAYSFHDLEQALGAALLESKHALVEEHLKGKKLVVSIVRGGRGEHLYACMPKELQQEMNTASTASPAEHKEVSEMAKVAHEAFGLGHLSASTFVITPKGKAYILDTNPMPDISKDSVFAESLKATGWQPSEFVEHAIKEAFKKES